MGSRLLRGDARYLAALALAGAASAAPFTASAQFAERLSFGVEGAVSTQLLEPQSEQYGFGFSYGARAGLRLAGPLGVQLFGAQWRWGSNQAQLQGGVLTSFGGGLRLAPEVSRRAGRFVLDLDAGFSITGSDDAAARNVRTNALLLAGGVGWLFPLASVVSLGPIVRVNYLMNLGASSGDRDRALFWTAGLSITFHGARAEARTAPPEDGPGPRRLSEDTDQDGVPDAADRCVAQPETMNGFRDDDGCPDTAPSPDDPDADMVSGSADRCPNEPEDLDGFQDGDGCPEPDNDNDGVPDAQDQCGDQPETRNGVQDDDGCPDAGGSPGAGSVVINGPRITFAQPVLLAGRDVAEGSRAMLDFVAQQLAAHPEVRRVRVECRTDEGGSDRRNARASAQCAKAVVRYLRRAGVDKRRLQARGEGSLNAGPGEPTTRVELVIVDPEGGLAPGAPAAAPVPTAAEPAAPEEGGRHGRHGRRRRRHH